MPSVSRSIDSLPLSVGSGAQDTPDLRLVRRCSNIRVVFARTQDAGANEIHERNQCQQPPAEAAHDPRIGKQLIQQGDDERDDRHDHQRSPDADRVIGQVDIPIANMRELVEDDGSECGRVADRKRHKTPAEREFSTSGRPEGEAKRPCVDQLPTEARATRSGRPRRSGR